MGYKKYLKDIKDLRIMGIDHKAGGRVTKKVKRTKTNDVYLKLLVKLYTFLARRTDSKFNRAVLARLNHSRVSRYPISVSNIAKNLANNKDKIAVCVCKVLNDERLLDLPKMTVCALSFSEDARPRIVAAGGICMTFD